MELLAAGALLLAGASIGGLLVLRRRDRRRVSAGLAGLAHRLGETWPDGESSSDVGRSLARLGRAVDAAARSSGEHVRLVSSLTKALEAIPLGVVLAGPGGDVLFRNEAAASFVDTRLEEALAARDLEEVGRAAGAGEPVARTLELHGPPRRTLVISGVPLDGEGTAAVVIEDVSERRRLEAVRRDFVANVSHELKTPVGALGLLAETLASEDDIQVVHRLAERVQNEAFRVGRIIDDLLDLSRLEAEEVSKHEPVAVQAVISEAVDQVRPAAGLREVGLEAADVPRHWSVRGERRQLVSALFNLLDNAVKYSEPGEKVEVRAETDGRVVDVVVEDHGIGIPSRDLDRIFERFYRVDRGRGRDTGGTGLGLAIVRHVAANHGGEVLVRSQEGEGSVFRLRLPVEPGPVGLVAEAG